MFDHPCCIGNHDRLAGMFYRLMQHLNVIGTDAPTLQHLTEGNGKNQQYQQCNQIPVYHQLLLFSHRRSDMIVINPNHKFQK